MLFQLGDDRVRLSARLDPHVYAMKRSQFLEDLESYIRRYDDIHDIYLAWHVSDLLVNRAAQYDIPARVHRVNLMAFAQQMTYDPISILLDII